MISEFENAEPEQDLETRVQHLEHKVAMLTQVLGIGPRCQSMDAAEAAGNAETSTEAIQRLQDRDGTVGTPANHEP